MGVLCSTHGREEIPDRKRPLGRPRRRWEVHLTKISWEGVDWMHLAQKRDQ